MSGTTEEKNVSKQELERRLASILDAIGATEQEVSNGRLVYESVGKAGEATKKLDAWDAPAPAQKGAGDDGEWPRDLAAASVEDAEDVEKPCGTKSPKDEDEARRRR